MFKRLTSVLMAIALCVSPVSSSMALSSIPIEAAAIPTRQSDKSSTSSGYTLVPIRGNFYTVSPEAVLARLNQIRKEACDEGVINPETGRPLSSSDYNPIRWSSALEKIAQTRAAEAAVVQAHTRPNGTRCFTCSYDGQQSWAEDLAWNWSGIMAGIEQWYEEKGDWVNQNKSAVTGHYTSMINPSYNHVALGCFRLASGGWYSVSGEFSFYSGLNESFVGVSGLYDQYIEVPMGEASNYAKYAGESHTLRRVAATATTCEDAGNTEYYVCIDCGKFFSDSSASEEISKSSVTIPKKGHAWGEWIVTKAATEKEDGVETRTCKNDASHVETRTIAKKEHIHTPVKEADKNATCTDDGYTGATKCSECGAVLTDRKIIPAIGHNWGDWEIVQEVTDTTDGLMMRTCLNDPEHIERKEIPAEDNRIDVEEFDIDYYLEDAVYTGKPLRPLFITYDDEELIEGEDYIITYFDNINVGIGRAVIEGIGDFKGETDAEFDITPAENVISVSPSTKTIKYSKLKSKGQYFNVKATAKEGAKASYKLVYAPKAVKKYIAISKAGKLTVKKGLVKGTYKIKVRVTAAATANYKKTIKDHVIKIVGK